MSKPDFISHACPNYDGPFVVTLKLNKATTVTPANAGATNNER
jgi:hypothetical protein